MRFAPNPSGPLHIGHARAAALNDAYVKQYGGRYILRIEDTDPKRVDPGAYGTVREDIRWLGLGITETVTQSDRLPIYYDLCKHSIERGGGVRLHLRQRAVQGGSSRKRRPAPVGTSRGRRTLSSGERCSTTLSGKARPRSGSGPIERTEAMRDFPAFRILDSPPHPMVKAHVYPLMNFSVVADDHLLGVTHVIRGKDHIANTRRERYIYDHFGWSVPATVTTAGWGSRGSSSPPLNAPWDQGGDVYRWGRYQARHPPGPCPPGILPEAVKNAMIAIGIGDVDISFSWDNLYAENRKSWIPWRTGTLCCRPGDHFNRCRPSTDNPCAPPPR